MNIQAMMKQVQQVQKEMSKEKQVLDKKEWSEENSLVKITMTGSKEVKSFEIKEKDIEPDDIEMLEESITLALNKLISTIENETNEVMSKYTKGIPGL